jgi:hypothetical protein
LQPDGSRANRCATRWRRTRRASNSAVLTSEHLAPADFAEFDEEQRRIILMMMMVSCRPHLSTRWMGRQRRNDEVMAPGGRREAPSRVRRELRERPSQHSTLLVGTMTTTNSRHSCDLDVDYAFDQLPVPSGAAQVKPDSRTIRPATPQDRRSVR